MISDPYRQAPSQSQLVRNRSEYAGSGSGQDDGEKRINVSWESFVFVWKPNQDHDNIKS